MTIEEALDFEGLGIYDENIKTYIQNEIEKETLRATTVEDSKVNNTDVAKSNALGLVKSGTDITVDLEGNVSVNDYTHQHLLENISDLLTTKDELNILNGIDVQTTELNQLKGVTSNVQEQLNEKAPLDSPDLTGIPTAPTAETGTKTTQIATTEFVQNEITGMEEKSAAKTLWGEPVNSYIDPYSVHKFAIPFHKESLYEEYYGSYKYGRDSIDSKNKSFYANDGLWYQTKRGTTSQIGYSELILGSEKWSNVDTGTYMEGNQYGILTMYGKGSGNIGKSNGYMSNYYVQIVPNVLTINRTITIPDASGTLALTSSNVASADKAIKAEQDIDGNVIKKTYAKLNSPVFLNTISIGQITLDGGTGDYAACDLGMYCTVKNNGCVAEGYFAKANGYYSHAQGNFAEANGQFSYAQGDSSVADGAYSHAEGKGTVALEYQLAIGKYNDSTTATTYTAFVIGNGSGSTSRSNAFRVDYDGTPYAKNSFVTTGADYAEFFEWLDGNPNNEDRRGYFVTLDGDKIKIASPGDYIVGIISGQPSVVGNGDESWMGRYIFDEFGAFVYEDYEYEQNIINEETGEFETVKKQGKRYKENPAYDPTKSYIQRSDRPEWDYVGMLGILSVRDDGTCQVNGYCTITDGGIATASDSGYRVVKRVTDNVVKVVFK